MPRRCGCGAVRKIAQRIRHLPGLERAEFLWRVLRKPYQRLLDAGGRGVEVKVGEAAAVRMPAEFAGGSWEKHEPQAVAAYAQWISSHPGALVLDIGSSVGIFSAIALFCEPHAQVVAFDSDLPSLAATRRMCRHASGARLRLVHGFLAERSTELRSLPAAAAETGEAVRQGELRGEPMATRYVCLTDAERGAIPSYRLDDLFAHEDLARRPVLIKCDVEGAELLVLRGAERLLRRAAPVLLLSVHPQALPDYGHSSAQVASFLTELGYQVRVLAVDHEEHWWCQPARESRAG
jgi:FkbM family methyltransferase